MKIKWIVIGYLINEIVWMAAAYLAKGSYIWYALGGMLFYFAFMFTVDVLYPDRKEEEQ